MLCTMHVVLRAVSDHARPSPRADPWMPTRPSRRLCFSVTVTPTARVLTYLLTCKGGSRMRYNTGQLAMVRAVHALSEGVSN